MRSGRTLSNLCLGAFAVFAIGSVATATAADDKKPVVVLDTTVGPITIELDAEKAPVTVENFLKLVDAKFYDGLIFHRVIADFMIQGGGLTPDMKDKSDGQKTIKNESNNGLSNKRGTIAMARKGHPDSASCQFYINVKDNGNLDGGTRPEGYTVFGKVIDGMDHVDTIRTTPTTSKMTAEGPMRDVPATPIVIKTIKRKAKS